MNYIPTIGLEIHAEAKTKSKIFCGCRNNPHEGEINAFVCPVCMGYPGAMPYIQREAIEKVLFLGVALGGELATYTQFDRKHYFYPDIPKGFQISQYQYPLVSNAKLCDIDITRIHLEEDTAKSMPDPDSGEVLLDFNRSGVPLLELVTEPVIHTSEDGVRFAQEFQRVLQLLDVSNARMERGEMRVEANVSVSDSDDLGTKVEVKNLNSFKIVQKSIEYEIKRQRELLSRGEKVVQETRGFDDSTGETYSQRLKETAQEYRFAPEPDIPPLDISLVPEWSREEFLKRMPELPEATRTRYQALGIPEEQAFTLTAVLYRQIFFDDVLEAGVKGDGVKLAANYITSDLAALDQEEKVYTHLMPKEFVALIALIQEGKVSSRGAKNILAVMVESGGDPVSIAEEEGLFQQSDEGVLRGIVEKVVEDNPSVVEDFRKGKESAVQFFVGQVMKETKGSANPHVVSQLVKEALG